jgi:sterol carrier protein 2
MHFLQFLKPQSHLRCYTELAHEAVSTALADARINYTHVKEAVVGYTYGDTDCGQAALYQIGLTGIPIHNVNNACATGAAAIYLGKQLINNDDKDCVLVLGFDKLESESYSFKYTDRTNPFERLVFALNEITPVADGKDFVLQMLDCVGKEYMKKYDFKFEKYAEVAYKNHKHSVHNPYARMQTEYSIKDIKESQIICGGLTKLQYCPLSDGASCVILGWYLVNLI